MFSRESAGIGKQICAWKDWSENLWGSLQVAGDGGLGWVEVQEQELYLKDI